MLAEKKQSKTSPKAADLLSSSARPSLLNPKHLPASKCLVGLSTSSVFPESTASCFEIASALGFDGIEVMVGVDPLSTDTEYLKKLCDYHQVPILSVHAPCLLVTQNTWGGPWEKLEKSGEMAVAVGADVVVVHPPFRWQTDYARRFEKGIRKLNKRFPITFTVENMYPWGKPVAHLQAYAPSWDPTDLSYEHLTLDLSHSSIAHKKSIDYVRSWGKRLKHLHLTDGTGKMLDEHLFPGEGDQDAWKVVKELRKRDFTGHIILEINSRKMDSRAARQAALGDSLAKIRKHLGQAPENNN